MTADERERIYEAIQEKVGEQEFEIEGWKGVVGLGGDHARDNLNNHCGIQQGLHQAALLVRAWPVDAPVSPWISVKDQLPRAHGPDVPAVEVLAVDDKGEVHEAFRDSQHRWITCRDGKPWPGVTYWTPKPGPPHV